MKGAIAITAALASLLAPLAAASPIVERGSSADKNPFLGKQFYVSPFYAKEIDGAIKTFKAQKKFDLAAKAAKVAKVSTFIWVSSFDALPSITTYLKDARKIQQKTGKKQVVQLVVYNLPDRDCSAKASAGELILSEGGKCRWIFNDVYARTDIGVS
ncbi:hypothetical protein FRC03_003162 [Tulasnella sp. 419]|nr:hypothetical protein FRC03_003162 [Tulasnella sp. 419]